MQFKIAAVVGSVLVASAFAVTGCGAGDAAKAVGKAALNQVGVELPASGSDAVQRDWQTLNQALVVGDGTVACSFMTAESQAAFAKNAHADHPQTCEAGVADFIADHGMGDPNSIPPLTDVKITGDTAVGVTDTGVSKRGILFQHQGGRWKIAGQAPL